MEAKVIRIELNDTALYAILWSAVIAGAVTLVSLATLAGTERTKAAFQGGYEQTTVPGSHCVVWHKVK